MKKNVVIVLVFVLGVMIMIGCQSKDSGDDIESPTDTSEKISGNKRPENLDDYEVVRVHGDRVIYHELEGLEEAAEIVIVGRVEETQQQLDYEYSIEFGKEILMDATSYSKVKVLKVLAGDSNLDEVVVKQECGVLEEEKQLVTFSEMTPLEKGDVWIFFLYAEHREEEAEDVDEDFLQNTYWCAGDYTGRYPMPDESLIAETDEAVISEEVKTLDYGVWEELNAQYDLYMEILEKYDLTL